MNPFAQVALTIFLGCLIFVLGAAYQKFHSETMIESLEDLRKAHLESLDAYQAKINWLETKLDFITESRDKWYSMYIKLLQQGNKK